MMKRFRVILLASTCVWTYGSAQAQQITSPNISTTPDPVSVPLQGTVFVNQGMVGAGRVSSSAVDFMGDTLGSFSGMAIDLSTWRRNADGSYGGVFYTLPDRGYNSAPFFSDYAGRLHRFNVLFNPYYGITNLPAATSSQSQIQLTPAGGVLLRDDAGNTFTGFDPRAGQATRLGAQVPMPAAGTGAGRISLDAEALAFHRNGTLYISDEYGANVYHFSKEGKLIGVINPPAALLPRTGGNLDFNSVNPPEVGRRNNQGIEGLSISPDGKKLITVLQSATVQDSNEAAGQQFRSNTRIMVYDISSNATPTKPVEHYVLQLPTLFRGNTTGPAGAGAVNRTAAQSEILALNDKQLLVLSRDGNGLGNDATNAANGGSDGRPLTFKSILLVDFAAATNIAGTSFETSTTPVAPNGVLQPTIKAVEKVELVNILNTTQLARFGLNTSSRPANGLSVSEKWEAMGLAPVLDEKKPQDFFLFVGNDNDFLTRNGSMQGNAYNGGVESDSQMYAYRLTLPTYVDPQYLNFMLTGAPIIASSLTRSAFETGESADRNIAHQLGAIRRGSAAAWAANNGVWVGANAVFTNDDVSVTNGVYSDRAAVEGTLTSGTVGADTTLAPGLRVGVAATIGSRSTTLGSGFGHRTEATTLSAYAGYLNPLFYLHGIANVAPNVSFEDIRRPGAYGLTAVGETDGRASSFSVEAGVPLTAVAGLTITPFAGARYTRVGVDGFTETGAAGGNVTYASQSYQRTVVSGGLEVATKVMNIVPSLRIGYSHSFNDKDETMAVSLASAQSTLATQSVSVPLSFQNTIDFSAGLQIGLSPSVAWSLKYDARVNAEKTADVSHSVMGIVRIGF